MKKGTANKIICLLLAILIMTTAFLYACGEKKDDGGEKETQSGDTTTGGENVPDTTPDVLNMAAREAIKDGLPEADFEQAEFNIYARTEQKDEFIYDEALSGEVVNDAVYKRNLAVEDRFNIKINTITEDGNWDKQASFMNKLKNSVQAGDDEFNLVAGYAAYITTVAAQGFVHNLNSIEHLDFSKPWWSQDIAEELNINGKMFFTTGDIALTMWEFMFAIYFNKTVVKDYNVEDPYQLVRSGKWTIDKLSEICKNVYVDVNGDDKAGKEDLYGYATETGNLVDVFHIAFDNPVTKKGEDGLPYHSIAENGKMAAISDKLYELLWNSKGVIAQGESVVWPENPYRELFMNDRAMFIPEYLGNAKELRNMDSDFGIIPYPKWDESQTNYYTISQDGYSLFSIPVTVKDMKMTGIITEALCAESYKKVIPAFYDVALKSKYSRDVDSVEMIDTIRKGLRFNFGILYTVEAERAFHILRVMMSNKKHDFTSEYEKIEGKITKALAKILVTYE